MMFLGLMILMAAVMLSSSWLSLKESLPMIKWMRGALGSDL